MAALRVRAFDRSSRKRVARIHWSRRDLLHIALWSVVLIAAVLWVAVWVSGHAF